MRFQFPVRIKIVIVLTIFTALSANLFAANNEPNEHLTNEKSEVKIAKGHWMLSGYLPEDPSKKVWLEIKDGTIEKISNSKPDGLDKGFLIVETDNWIFPGLIDMHNHLLYNVLPLWPVAKSQFRNRFEWREHFPPYEDVKSSVRPLKSEPCAPLRWAELKALSAGVTVINGVGSSAGYKCVSGYGPLNMEISEDFSNDKEIEGAKVSFEIFHPALMTNVFEKNVEPIMSSSQFDYLEGNQNFETEYGIVEWLNDFSTASNDVYSGLHLAIGSERAEVVFAKIQLDWSSLDAKAQKTKLLAELTQVGLSDNEALELTHWLLGGGRDNTGFLNAKSSYGRRLLGENGLSYTNLPFTRMMAKYSSEVPLTREKILEYLEQPKSHMSFITHLSEGQSSDEYSAKEYKFAKKLGLARPGFNVIHGIGMSKSDFEHAAKNDVTLIWSLFSNLLLYGETLDVKEALKAGVNIALGPDWSPTGSKNLLDEMLMIWKYNKIKKLGLSAQKIMKMGSLNGAIALNLAPTSVIDDHKFKIKLGRIREGYMANIVLVKRLRSTYPDISKAKGREHFSQQDRPFREWFWQRQKGVNLVVVKGLPSYGSRALVNQVVSLYAKPILENVPSFESLERKDKRPCDMDMSFVFPGDHKESTNMLTSYDLRNILKGSGFDFFPPYKSELDDRQDFYRLDPIFACQDPEYDERFKNFLEKEWPENLEKRNEYRLKIKGEWKAQDVKVW